MKFSAACFLCFLIAWAVIACSPQIAAGSEPMPTAPEVAEVTEEPTATPVPPTPTPLRRPTLPPTWTPTHTPTELPAQPTATPQPVTSSNADVDPRLADCLQFGPDYSRNPTTVVVGNPVTVYWKPAGGGGFYYEVVLRDLNGNELDLSRRMPSSRQYTFSQNLFQFNQVYTWSVTPYNSRAEPICPTRTSELRASLR